MAIEFKNSNQFRSYPFLDDDKDSPFSRRLSRLFVDARINLYTDQVRNEGEILVAGFSEVGIIDQTLSFNLMIAGGVRDSGDNIVVGGDGSGRRPISLPYSKSLSSVDLYGDPEYITFWIYFDSTKTGGSPVLFDEAIPAEDEFKGSEFVVSGYISVSKRELTQLPADQITDTGMITFSPEIGVVINDTSACFEDTVFNNTSSQLCRKILLANKDSIPAADNDPEDNERLIRQVSGQFDGEVEIHPGLNCKAKVDSNNSKLTIIPTVSAGDGEPCNGSSEDDPDAEFCDELIFSVNGVLPDSGGRINFGSVAHLQVSQFSPLNPNSFVNSYTGLSGFSAGQFWAHCLVFRIGDWGSNDNTPCEPPDCV